MPGHSAASRFSAARSNVPSGLCAITAFGMPFSRMSAVSARVSMPVMAMMPRALSQASKSWLARQLDGAVMAARSTQPRTPDDAARLAVSMSSALTPTLPIWGKVKVTIWPA